MAKQKKPAPKKPKFPKPRVTVEGTEKRGTKPALSKGPKKELPPDPPEGPPPAQPGTPEAQPLNEDEQRFIDEWLIDRHPPRAYMRAFAALSHATARTRGYEMSNRPHVRLEMRAARHAQRLRCRVSADLALDELCRVAFSDVNDLFDPGTHLLRLPARVPLETRRAIAKVKVSRERRTEIVGNNSRTIVTDSIVEYTFWSKLDALSRLFEHLGLKVPLPPLQVLLQSLPPGMAQLVATAINPDAKEPKP